jgi:hypothetical protein
MRCFLQVLIKTVFVERMMMFPATPSMNTRLPDLSVALMLSWPGAAFMRTT